MKIADPQFLQKLAEVFGKPTSPHSFLQQSNVVFGPWDRALRQAGISNRKTRRLAREQWKKNRRLDIIRVIHWLAKNGHPLEYNKIMKLVDPQFLQKLAEVFGKSTSPNSFLQKSAAAFGPWSAALISYGLSEGSRAPIDLSISDISKVFKFLKHEDITWNEDFFVQAPTLFLQGELDKLTRSRIPLFSIYLVAMDYRPLDEWMGKFSLDQIETRNGKILISGGQLTSIVKAIAFDGLSSLKPTTARFNMSRSTKNIIKSIVGVDLSLRAVVLAATRDSADWKHAWERILVEAGLNLEDVYKVREPITPEEIISGIQALAQAGVPLNTYAIQNDLSVDTKKILRRSINKPRTGHSIYNSALYLGDPWPVWLSRAGLDVTEVMIQGKLPYALMNAVTRASLSQIEGNRQAILGDVDSVAFQYREDGSAEAIRADIQSSEDALLEKELNSKVQEFAELLTDRDQKLLNSLLDLVGTSEDIPDLMRKVIDADPSFSQRDITNLILRIRNQPEIIELLMPEAD